MIDLDYYQDRSTTISLLLTEQCNYQCGHCMYSCGPASPSGYMSNLVLAHVETLAQTLRDLGINITINLVGGEPTLNIREFERCFRIVRDWGFVFEMTSNGWWLDPRRPETTRRVLKIFEGMDADPDTFSLRISNDRFHQAYRDFSVERRLGELWEDGTLEEVTYYCNCGWESKTWPDDGECPECHLPVRDESDVLVGVEEPMSGYPWIYASHWQGDHGIAPQGRAHNWGDSDASRVGFCSVNDLGFRPNGWFMDACCRGSWMQFGTVQDHPLLLLELARRFIAEVKPSCYECREASNDWLPRMKALRPVIQKEIRELEEHYVAPSYIGAYQMMEAV